MKVRKPRDIFWSNAGLWVKIRKHTGSLTLGFDDRSRAPRLADVRRLHNWLGRYIAWREQEEAK